MAQENVEVVRRVYEAWARGEFPGPAELLDPKIEYVNPAGAVEPGTRHGLDAFAQAVEKVFEGWATWQGGGGRVGTVDRSQWEGGAVRVVSWGRRRPRSREAAGVVVPPASDVCWRFTLIDTRSHPTH